MVVISPLLRAGRSGVAAPRSIFYFSKDVAMRWVLRRGCGEPLFQPDDFHIGHPADVEKQVWERLPGAPK